jgi:SAM-dependent methyltransferase
VAGPVLDWGVGNYERTAQALHPAAQVLVQHAGLTAGERVLDLGCGTGNVALLAAAAGAAVTAVDPSQRLLDVTAAAAAEQGLSVDCHVGEAASVPAANGAFDCVLSSFAVIFAPDPVAAVAEISRVLTAPGRALLTAWLPGGALGEMAVAAQEMVRTALGAPPPPPSPVAWHEEMSVGGLVASQGMTAALVGVHELVFTAPSPEAFLAAEQANHPLAIAGHQVLQAVGQADSARERLLQIVTEHNEDEHAFRSTSRYVVIRLQRES